MSEDTLRRYGRAVMNVLDAMSRREGASLPSSDVIDKALKVLGADPRDRPILRNVAPAIVYRVRSASKPGRVHLVALYVRDERDGLLGSIADLPQETEDDARWCKYHAKEVLSSYKIIDAECSCEATTTCWHLLVALTLADNDGYHLDAERESA